MAKVIGIDLGTTNSVCSVLEGGEPVVITNPEGQRLTPSVVGFKDDDERIISWAAKRQAVTNPKNTIFSIKRFMGRRGHEVEQEEKMVPYQVTGGHDDLVKVHVRGKEYTPPEISAMVLRYIKEYAEDYLGEEVKEAVITVPAYFNDSQRQATKDAGTIAGLEVKRIINEPTAAALAYGLDKKIDQKIAVFDLGGGTFDISILEISGGGESVFSVLSTNGNTHLGGDNFDEELIHYVAEQFKKQEGVDLRQDPMALQRLREACEKAKCELSSAVSTQINLPFITIVNNVPKHLTHTLSRAQLESLVRHLVEKTKGPCLQALQDAKLKPEELNEVILVGGSTRMPAVQEMCRQIFKREPNKSVNPDEAVAIGAAIQGGILQGQVKDVLLLDVTPLSLGIETKGGVFTKLIERNSTIPTKKSQVFSTAADGQTSVEIHVLQGERALAIDNRTLGRFHLAEIPPAAAGMPQIEVTFDIDANGIMNVSAKDLGTGREQKIKIQSSSGLSKDDVERMRREAEQHSDEDQKRREVIELRNQADSLVLQTERSLREHGDKVDATVRSGIESAVNHLKGVKDKDDKSAIQKAMTALSEASHKLGEAIYKATAQSQPSAGPAQGATESADSGKKDGDIKDADFEVKN